MDEKYQIIRGKRILDQLLHEEELLERSTFPELERNAQTAVPIPVNRQKNANSDPINVTTLELLPFIGTRNLNVRAVVTNKGSTYNSTVIFNDVDFDADDAPDNVSFTAKDGNEYHVKPIILTQHTVRVRCNCLDFYWRFAAFNAKDKSLIGAPPKPYQRKTDRGPVNPQEVPGVCKHLMATIKALRTSGIVR